MLEKYTICTSKLCKQLVFLVLGGCTNPHVFGKTPIQVSLKWLGLLVDLARCLHAPKLKGTSVEDIDLSLFTGIRQKGNQPTSGF